MIVFPPCKINLGLNVVARRDDGYHDLESVLYPVQWNDALEAVENSGGTPLTFNCTGQPNNIPPGENIVEKAWSLLAANTTLPPLKVHLYKNVPSGAGLGGGSADGTFFLRLMREQFGIAISDAQMKTLALQLGSDCPYFLHDRPMAASGRGEILEPVNVNLQAYYLVVVYPGIHISTAAAFRGIAPARPAHRAGDVVTDPPDTWRNRLTNDFEGPVFAQWPELAELKKTLYTGSACYGLFRGRPQIEFPAGYRVHFQPPAPGIL